MTVRGYVPFREKEEGPREKCSFDEAKEETGQESASEIVRGASQTTSDVQILLTSGETNPIHLITPQTTIQAGR